MRVFRRYVPYRVHRLANQFVTVVANEKNVKQGVKYRKKEKNKSYKMHRLCHN